MTNPTKEYLMLFNTITDICANLEELKKVLMLAQQKAENEYIESDEQCIKFAS